MNVEIKPGAKLFLSELATINAERVRVFESKTAVNPILNPVEKIAMWILLKEGKENIKGFAKLSPVEINSLGTSYPVFLLSTVIASEPGKGLGRVLMEQVHQFAIEDGRSIIGFSETANIAFYQKTGFEVLSGEDNQFKYIDKEGKVMDGPTDWVGEVFYRNGADNVMETIMAQDDKTVLVPR